MERVVRRGLVVVTAPFLLTIVPVVRAVLGFREGVADAWWFVVELWREA